MEKPKLQVALDLQDLPSALSPLQKAAPHLDVIECGTILCLAEGMHAVRIIHSLFPAKPLLADVRIVEAGSLISKMAFDAGATWVSVVSGATLTTVEAVMKESAKRPSSEVQVELIDGWTWEQAKAWRDLGVPQVITHRSRDGEAKSALTWSKRDFDEICRLHELGFKVTVTGGVKPEEIPQFAGVPVFIFIAGRGIYAAADPAAAAQHYQDVIAQTYPSKT
jgi:3-dehydro-L-gulonate-6-phosphate decarboxylase